MVLSLILLNNFHSFRLNLDVVESAGLVALVLNAPFLDAVVRKFEQVGQVDAYKVEPEHEQVTVLLHERFNREVAILPHLLGTQIQVLLTLRLDGKLTERIFGGNLIIYGPVEHRTYVSEVDGYSTAHAALQKLMRLESFEPVPVDVVEIRMLIEGFNSLLCS